MELHDNEGIRVHAAPDCYLCGTQGAPLYQNLRDRLFGAPGKWDVKQCPNPECGLTWLDPKPIRDDISGLYVNYHTHTADATTPKNGRLTMLREFIRKSIQANVYGYRELEGKGWSAIIGRILAKPYFIQDRIGRGIMWLNGLWRGRLLDFGCGNGKFLAQMRQMGWDVTGFEPDTTAAQVAREHHGLDVYEGEIEQAGLSESSFDVITMNHVIEHLLDPVHTLQVCAGLLKKGGRLVVVTPNVASLGHRWFRHAWRGLEPPRHLHLFSLSSLGACAEAGGLGVRDLWTSANSAPSVWARSRVIQKRGSLHSSNPADLQRRYLKGESRFFWGVEHLLTRFRPWGEEIVMIAEGKR